MRTFALTSLVAALPSAFAALPDVVAKPLPESCSSYPGYDANTGVAGPWTIKTVNNENTAIEGFSDTFVYSIAYNPNTDRQPSLRWGYFTFPTRNDVAKVPFECSNNTLLARPATELTAAGAPTNYQWTPAVISPYPYDAGLMYKIEGSPVKPFEHYVDGVKQDGVFLGGYDNTTTWGFKYYPADQGSSGLEYYYVRLLGPNSADANTGAPLQANETRGFIKIAA